MAEDFLYIAEEREPEIWLPVFGYEDLYEISSWGNVKSLERIYYTGMDNKIKRFLPERIMKQRMVIAPSSKSKIPYFKVMLCKDGFRIFWSVHQLVAIHFVPNPNNLKLVNHIDYRTLNNYYKNLEWNTHLQNIQHSHDRRMAALPKGEDRPEAKLSEADIKYIKENYKFRDKEFNGRRLAKKFNVSFGHISAIVQNKRWKHLT
jgi:hypothetical protein